MNNPNVPEFPSNTSGAPLAPIPANVPRVDSFPVAVLILLHFFTCGIFSLIWLNLVHGKLPRNRPDDPSAGKAIGFCFIPFFNLYWIFFTYRRLALRVDEERARYDLPPSNLIGLATATCIVQVIPYLNILGIITLYPIFAGMMQSSVNQLARAKTTTPRGTGPDALPPGPGMPAWAIVLLILAVSILPVAILAGLLLPALAKAKQKAETIRCMTNMKQIGLAFRIWEGDNKDLYPFNVSVTNGGSMEDCMRGPNGFDQNSWRDFQVMGAELNNPRILICPGDHQHTQASDFAQLGAQNVSYLVHSGTNVSETHPQNTLAICPIHRVVLRADGSVVVMNKAQMAQVMAKVANDQ